MKKITIEVEVQEHGYCEGCSFMDEYEEKWGSDYENLYCCNLFDVKLESEDNDDQSNPSTIVKSRKCLKY